MYICNIISATYIIIIIISTDQILFRLFRYENTSLIGSPYIIHFNADACNRISDIGYRHDNITIPIISWAKGAYRYVLALNVPNYHSWMFSYSSDTKTIILSLTVVDFMRIYTVLFQTRDLTPKCIPILITTIPNTGRHKR